MLRREVPARCVIAMRSQYWKSREVVRDELAGFKVRGFTGARLLLRRRMKNEWNHPQTLRGSFSAVSTATIATKYSFFQDFRDLQDLHTFAPLRSQNFSKKPSKFLTEWKWNFIFHSRFSMKFAIFRRNFDEILPEFHRHVQEMSKKLTLLKVWGKRKV